MMQFLKRMSKKTGLSPGSLIYVGEKKVESVKVNVIDYDEEHVLEKEVTDVHECFEFKDTETATWINISGIHDVGILEKIGDHFGIHPLVLEDVMNTHQRPKMEDFEDYVFIVLKIIRFDVEKNEINSEQVSLIVGPRFVISFQEREGDIFDPVRERIRKGKGRIRRMGPGYLAYALADSVVDNYFGLLERLGDVLEKMQLELMDAPRTETLQSIYELRRETILLRKSIWPLREVVGGLERGESSLFAESTRPFLRDLYDHTIQVIDTVETVRDMLSGMLDLYLSSVSNRMNEVMKVLTIIATIFIPVTFVAGIYGMNFENMPELRFPFGYPVALLVMLGIGIAMLVYFRKKGWI
ncbi:MAG: magnesium/cobalt transporter CorA [Candidatus Eiseniibacteriota bacterium]|nr:MAG: magnesium/cobalt transporter CorA [Candidatus Eisenbacteria bacterium]